MFGSKLGRLRERDDLVRGVKLLAAFLAALGS